MQKLGQVVGGLPGGADLISAAAVVGSGRRPAAAPAVATASQVTQPAYAEGEACVEAGAAGAPDDADSSAKYIAWGGGLLPAYMCKGLDSPLLFGPPYFQSNDTLYGGAEPSEPMQLPKRAEDLTRLIESGGVKGASLCKHRWPIEPDTAYNSPVWLNGARKHVIDPITDMLVPVFEVPNSELQCITVLAAMREFRNGVGGNIVVRPCLRPWYLRSLAAEYRDANARGECKFVFDEYYISFDNF